MWCCKQKLAPNKHTRLHGYEPHEMMISARFTALIITSENLRRWVSVRMCVSNASKSLVRDARGTCMRQLCVSWTSRQLKTFCFLFLICCAKDFERWSYEEIKNKNCGIPPSTHFSHPRVCFMLEKMERIWLITSKTWILIADFFFTQRTLLDVARPASL